MVKAKATEKFDLKDFASLKNIKRANPVKNKDGSLYENDTFECDEKMADYLTGNNPLNKKVVEIIEVKKEEPKAEKIEEAIVEEIKPKETLKKNKKSKK